MTKTLKHADIKSQYCCFRVNTRLKSTSVRHFDTLRSTASSSLSIGLLPDCFAYAKRKISSVNQAMPISYLSIFSLYSRSAEDIEAINSRSIGFMISLRRDCS